MDSSDGCAESMLPSVATENAECNMLCSGNAMPWECYVTENARLWRINTTESETSGIGIHFAFSLEYRIPHYLVIAQLFIAICPLEWLHVGPIYKGLVIILNEV